MSKPRSVVEFGVEATEGQLKLIQNFLDRRGIPFYIEPPMEEPYMSLAELEADCEGK